MAKYSNGFEDKIHFSDASVKVLEKRYLMRDDLGNLTETGEGMFRRVANNIAQADKIYDSNADIEKISNKFYDMLSNIEFLPNSPTLMNAGRDLQQLSACFVLPIQDDLREIYKTLTYTALVHQSGGGTGFSFGRIRPNGAIIKSTKGRSPGPISFLDVYNASTGQITQGGTRRGANMCVQNCNHPDVMDFVYVKEQEGIIENFNISIAVSDEFMDLVEKDGFYELKDPRGIPYTIREFDNRRTPMLLNKGVQFKPVLERDGNKLVNNRTNKVLGKIENERLYLNAKEVFDCITYRAWRNGEPGIIFLDKINKYNATPEIGKIESTNPCGEQPLLPYEACNLGSINLAKFVDKKAINWKKLEDIVAESVHFMDNVITMNKLPLQEIEEMTNANRKIGMGVMGFADMLIRMGISYSSNDAKKIAEEVMYFIKEKAEESSYNLAEQRGVFPNFDKSIFKNKRKRRNATLTTIAPTGTISVIAGASSGIEPIYAIAYKRKVKETIGQDLIEVNAEFKKYADEKGFSAEDAIKITTDGENDEKIEIDYGKIPKNLHDEVKKLFVTAHDIDYMQHIDIQSIFQKFTDNAVSKTINFPHSATHDDIKNAYKLAYNLECKGITIYRDKSRDKQLLTTGGSKEGEDLKRGDVLELPEYLPSSDYLNQRTPWGKLHMHIDCYKENPAQIFTQLGKGGQVVNADLEGMSRLASLCLRLGGSLEQVVKQLEGVGSQKMVPTKEGNISSLSDGIAIALKKYMLLRKEYEKEREGDKNIKVDPAKVAKVIKENKISKNEADYAEACPECGSKMEAKEGCWICSSEECGYSKC
jgi:ribonucleoside-diphosphate reductase alpha chain